MCFCNSVKPTCRKSLQSNHVHKVRVVLHYENTPMQYTAIFNSCKNDNFKLKFFDYFHIFAQNIYCGYTLEPVLMSTNNICFKAKIRK